MSIWSYNCFLFNKKLKPNVKILWHRNWLFNDKKKREIPKNILWIFILFYSQFLFSSLLLLLNVFLLSYYVQQQFDICIYCIILSRIFTSKKTYCQFFMSEKCLHYFDPFYCYQFTFGLSYKNVSLIGCICKLTDLE